MSNLDFTFAKYTDLCETIVDAGYSTLTFAQFFSLHNTAEQVILLRHDVDRKPERALQMAKIENSFGICSTYYFRKNENVFKPAMINEIVTMGHEIGYHYEVLDKTKGDYEEALRVFETELEEFRRIYDVKTICMHGNPFSKWVNKDLWTEYKYTDFGIIGEPYLSIDYKKVLYLTDTSRRWNSKFSVKDVVGATIKPKESLKSTDDVIKLVKDAHTEQICILAHPERWSDSFGAWLKELVWQNTKNMGKAILVKRAYKSK